MCCFSGPIAHVSGTSIFARLEGGRQLLAYQMRFTSLEDIAMILPLPISHGHGDLAVEFVNLTETPQLFDELGQCFRSPPSRSVAADAVAGGPTPLVVRRIGAYDASFVPAIADFARLDPRFRLPDAVLARMPAYADYGFAVFQLRKGEAEVHPMALRFMTRRPDRLFFPTVHAHHGDAPADAAFDHTLYLQAPAGVNAKHDWEPATHAVSEVVSLGNILRRDPTHGLIDRKWPLFRRQINGVHPNSDTWADPI